jgi:hypothetical protein
MLHTHGWETHVHPHLARSGWVSYALMIDLSRSCIDLFILIYNLFIFYITLKLKVLIYPTRVISLSKEAMPRPEYLSQVQTWVGQALLTHQASSRSELVQCHNSWTASSSLLGQCYQEWIPDSRCCRHHTVLEDSGRADSVGLGSINKLLIDCRTGI